MVSATLAVLLLCAVFALLRDDKARERRIAAKRELPRQQLLPGHYRSFVEIEKKLWAAAEDSQRTTAWDKTKVKLRTAEWQSVREYVRGLREDFARSNRIFSVVVRDSPDEQILKTMEWHRNKIALQYYASLILVDVRLRTGRVSPRELHQLTQAVAAMAYEVRSIVRFLENEGRDELVEMLLRQC